MPFGTQRVQETSDELTSSERIFVQRGNAGVLELTETTAPSATAGVGKVYVKATDSKLYFKNDSGVEIELGASGSVYIFSTGLTNTANTITANLATGKAGSQSVIGGIAASETLTLSSTIHATKGKILFGTSAYDEVNNRLGLGTTSPTEKLDVAGNIVLLKSGTATVGTPTYNSYENKLQSSQWFATSSIAKTLTGGMTIKPRATATIVLGTLDFGYAIDSGTERAVMSYRTGDHFNDGFAGQLTLRSGYSDGNDFATGYGNTFGGTMETQYDGTFAFRPIGGTNLDFVGMRALNFGTHPTYASFWSRWGYAGGSNYDADIRVSFDGSVNIGAGQPAWHPTPGVGGTGSELLNVTIGTQIINNKTSRATLVVKNIASQTANALEVQNSSGTVLTKVKSDGDIEVPDEVYDATAWNGSLEVPTKNAIRDKIETLSGSSLPTQTGNGRKYLRTDGTTAAWAFAHGNLTTFLVAASDASAEDKAIADYVCDGTADDVEIQAALDLVKLDGGTVLLSAGTFTRAAALVIDGPGGADGANVSLRGQGNESTIINGSGNLNGIELTDDPKVNISDIQIGVTGTGHGIKSTAEATTYRGFWNSTFKNIYVRGDFSTHTGYSFYLEGPFRSVFENCEGNGVGNGMYLAATNGAFNPGNCVFIRCFFDLSQANGKGYYLYTPDAGGQFNICTFIQCEAIDSETTSTTSIGWHFRGSSTSYFATKNIQVISSNTEQFNTAIKLEHAIQNTLQFNYVDTKSGATGTIVDITANSSGNDITILSGYVGTGTTTKLVNDLNTSTTAPTYIKRYEAYVEGTLNVTTSVSTILTDINTSGPGTIAAGLTNINLKLTPKGSGIVVSSADITVPDEAYDATAWNGSLEVPTKNAVRDKIEALSVGGVTDGDKGDITVTGSGATWTIDNGVVSLAKMANMATASLIYRKTAGTGAPEVNTLATLKTDLALVKADVGLGNVDNTSDANKPVSTATQTALDAKQALDADLTTIAGLTATTDNVIQSVGSAWASRTPAQLKTSLALVKVDVGLGNVDNTSNATERAATRTLTNARITERVATSVDAATHTIDSDATDLYTITAQAQAFTIAAPTGTPTQGQKLMIRIKDNGTARAITWNAIFRVIGVTLPTTTVVSKTHYIGAVYNTTDSKWDVLAVGVQA